VIKSRFGTLLRQAREANGLSLRGLAESVEIEYSRLAKMENGTRPAPGLAEIRRLAEVLDLDMGELLVSTGTPREVVAHLLWSERLHVELPTEDRGAYVPERTLLLRRNTFRVPVVERHGARCTVALGGASLEVFSFADADILTIHIPPEAVEVHHARPDEGSTTAENILEARLKKVRRLGQVANLVLVGDGFELNTLHSDRVVERLALTEGVRLFASVQATAIRTEEPSKEA